MAKGDHIRVRRGLYWHHGIDCGDGKVIHLNGSPLRSRNATVCCTSLPAFSRGNPVQIVSHHMDEDPEAVLDRAESRLGESCYDLMSNNCEHFASWCRSGLAESRQVKRVLKGIKTTVAVGIVAAAVVAGMRQSTGRKAMG